MSKVSEERVSKIIQEFTETMSMSLITETDPSILRVFICWVDKKMKTRSSTMEKNDAGIHDSQPAKNYMIWPQIVLLKFSGIRKTHWIQEKMLCSDERELAVLQNKPYLVYWADALVLRFVIFQDSLFIMFRTYSMKQREDQRQRNQTLSLLPDHYSAVFQ